MQSKLAARVSRSIRLLRISESQSSPQRLLATAVVPTGLPADPAIHSGGGDPQVRKNTTYMPTGLPADPAIYSGDPEGIDAEEAVKAATALKNQITEHKPIKEMEPFVPPKPPYSPSPKLQHIVVNQPTDPITQQNRRNTTTTTTSTTDNTPKQQQQLEDVSCTGFVPTSVEEREGKWREKQRREQEEDDKEYFKHHKASPLSEIEVVDTRKPITRATDGTAADIEVDEMVDYYCRGEGVILWRPEQLDTAEDSLRRATEIWKQSAMRGIPDSPHGRVLRAMRGEDW